MNFFTILQQKQADQYIEWMCCSLCVNIKELELTQDITNQLQANIIIDVGYVTFNLRYKFLVED